jgi:hypothetical protein
MGSKRLPKFRRVSSVRNIELTSRDRDLIQLVYKHRFLRSSHITALLPGSRAAILRRLQLLYHNGYLERPRSQIDYYYIGGSQRIVYGLGSKGAAMLRQYDVTVRNDWGEKNRAVKRIFLEHALMVSDFMVAVEISCQGTGIKLVTQTDLKLQHPLQWRVKMNNGLKLAIMPDRVFTLEYHNHSGERVRACFFVEADRGTMPVIRKTLSQTSFYRKFLAYEATWKQGLHRELFGFRRFRVLTVTTSSARLNTLRNVCASLKSGHGLFLFSDNSILRGPQDIFSSDWQSSNGEMRRLLK